MVANGIPALNRLRRELQSLHGAQIITGVQGEPGTNMGGESITSSDELQKIAYVHEYGWDIEVTPKMRAWLHYNGIHLKKDTTRIHIPERSFLRQAQANGKAKFNLAFNEQVGQLIRGKITADGLLNLLGRVALEETVSALGANVKPVTQYTLEHRKQSPNPTPLLDTGGLQRHISYRIVKKSDSSGTAAKWGDG